MHGILGKFGCVQLDIIGIVFHGDPEVTQCIVGIAIPVGSGPIVAVVPSTVISGFILILCGLVVTIVVYLVQSVPLVARVTSLTLVKL